MTERIPDVTVVVISYNDAERLPAAIRSVQRQTLRNLEIIVVDDASSDDTADIVKAIAAEDPRVRYDRLPANSGGCSAPRNRGVDLARAPWVMFGDSDDEFERHACKNLLQAAERLGADLVCGTAERVDVGTGRRRRWRPEVHESTRVVAGLEEFPDLLSDTISVNKIYRRSMLEGAGIRFPEGLLFEDQLFTLEAFCASERIAVIPEVVYFWHVDRLTDEPSITQRRHEAANVESRIEINRRIDDFLDNRRLPAIQRIKDHKFLKHDLYLYLSSMLVVDDETARTLMERLLPYVSSMDLTSAWTLRPALRVAIYHLLVGDLDGIRAAMRFVKWASVVDRPIVAVGDREVWGCQHAYSGPDAAGRTAADWLDVTELHLLTVPFTQRRYLHRVEVATVTGGRMIMTGSTVDYDGRLSTDDSVELRYISGGSRTVMSVPAVWTGHDGSTLTWRAEGPASPALGRALQDTDLGTVALAIARGQHTNLTSARSDDAGPGDVVMPYPGQVGATGPDLIEITRNDNGAVGWRARSSAERSARARRRAKRSQLPAVPWLIRSSAMVKQAALPRLARLVGSVLPSRDLVLFETDGGRTAAGNARALSDYLHREHPGIEQAWIWRDDTDHVPSYARAVARLSIGHVWTAARARYWVDDGTAPLNIDARRAAEVVFAGEGVPIHRKGLDDPSVLVNRRDVRDVRRRSRRWTLMLTASAYDARITSHALAYSGRLFEAGLLRADGALPRPDAGTAEWLRRKEFLDLPTDRPVILYAPTVRRAGRVAVPSMLDLDEWAQQVGDRCYLLVLSHPLQTITVPTRLRFAVREVAGGDIADLIGAADLVISDYSSVIGDAALVGVPVIAFQPDRDVYVNRTHGIYPASDTVGPIATTLADLLELVEEWLLDRSTWDAEHADRYGAFGRELCGPADGLSTQRAAQAIVSRARDGDRS